MGRKYKRKTDKLHANLEEIARCDKLVLNCESLRKVAKENNVSKYALQRFVKKRQLLGMSRHKVTWLQIINIQWFLRLTKKGNLQYT